MKSISIFLVLFILSYQAFSQNIGINSSGFTPDPSAILDVQSLNKGLLIPRLTATEKLLISQPAEGLMVLDTTNDNLYFYRNFQWQLVGENGPLHRTGSRISQKGSYNDDFVIGNSTLPYSSSPMTEELFFFQKQKSAFRAGALFISQAWNTANIGNFSAAFGRNTLAKGDCSFSVGNNAKALANFSVTMGQDNIAEGNYSQALGRKTISPSYGELAIGLYNTDYTALGITTMNLADRAFVIGNGSIGVESDAFSVWKNGFVSIGKSDPIAKLDIYGEVGEDLMKVYSDNKNHLRLMSNGQFILGGGSHVARLQANAVHQEHAMQLKINGFQRFFVDSIGWTVVGADDPQARFDIQCRNNEKAFNVDIGGVKKFMIDGDGQVVIGDETPNARLQVNSDSSEDALRVKVNGTTRLLVDSNGGWSNHDATPSFGFQLENSSLDIRGRARAYSWNTYSDKRIKSNIRTLEYGLKDLMKLEPKNYDHHTTTNKDGRFVLERQSSGDVGLLAQDVYEIIPEAVSKPQDEQADLWTMDYTRLVPVLIKSIQEQQEMIEDLQKEIEALKKN